MSSLKERVEECLLESGKKKVELAEATRSPRATISDWTSGKTKAITGEKLLKAAAFFNVRPEWLATGAGKKREDYKTGTDSNANAINEPSKTDRARIVEQLSEDDWQLIKAFIDRIQQKTD